MKKTALFLVLCILFSFLSACTFNIPSISEAKQVIDAYLYYNQTGKVPPNIGDIIGITGNSSSSLQEIINETPEEILADTLKETQSFNILSLAEQYYNLTYPEIEADTKEEYLRLVTWKPDFSGKKGEIGLQKHNSANVALALSYTSAKNFYLSMAAAVLSINPDDITALGNFAAALAAYADDSIEENTPGVNASKFYEDAEKVYHYALLLADDMQYKNETLPILVSLGNLYLDSSKFKEAYGCFQAAREIGSEYYPAVEGLYNTYMALKEHKKALDLIAETAKFPAFFSAYRKVSEKNKEDEKKPGVSESNTDEFKLKQACDSLNTIDAISVADYLGEFDEEARDKLNNLIKQVQGRMVYKAPDITLITQYGTLEAISKPLGQSALDAYAYGLDHMKDNMNDLLDKILSREPSEEALNKLSVLTMQAKKSNDYDSYKAFFEGMSAIYPEFSVYTINPFEYENPVDIVVQRFNISMFTRKHTTYNGYLGTVNAKVIKEVEEIIDRCNERVDELWEAMNLHLSKLPLDASQAEIHVVHAKYYPDLNAAQKVGWFQATQAAVMTYQQKIKPYAEKMYNDCMKHVILISDDEIRQQIEDKLQLSLFSSLVPMLEAVYKAHSFTIPIGDCDCNIEAIIAQKKKEQEERDKLANEQIKRNMEAKKRFERGELDENSSYYQKIIKPYEVKINTPFVQGVVGPYKSGFKVKIDIPGVPPVLEFGKMENHIRNTTSYNGGIEVKSGPMKAFLKFSATQDSNGNFSANDVDILGGGELSFSKACSKITAGMEASALRGTKSYVNYEFTGEDFLNAEIKNYLGFWESKLKKKVWKGEYPMH